MQSKFNVGDFIMVNGSNLYGTIFGIKECCLTNKNLYIIKYTNGKGGMLYGHSMIKINKKLKLFL